MKLDLSTSASLGAIARVYLVDNATGKKTLAAVKQNLVLDSLLNGMADTGYAGAFSYCSVGSGTNPNSYSSGGVAMFTQSGTTVTAGASFFTSSMVGGILKYGASGSAGLEQYITGYTSPTQVTVATSNTQTAIAGTVWMVQQTALQTQLYQSNTYQTGNCGSSFSGNVQTLFRTFIFPTQAAPYNVNEIGYGKVSGAAIMGRIVLGSTVVVSPSQYLVVYIQMTVTQTPATITAFGNVGTNFDTSGNAALQCWCCTVVQSNGTLNNNCPGGGSCFDAFSSPPALSFHTANDITLNSVISPTGVYTLTTANNYVQNYGGNISNSGQPTGVYVTNVQTFSFTVSAGTVYDLIYGCIAGTELYLGFVLKLTTPFTLSAGTFSGSSQFKITFSRTLTNP